MSNLKWPRGSLSFATYDCTVVYRVTSLLDPHVTGPRAAISCNPTPPEVLQHSTEMMLYSISMTYHYHIILCFRERRSTTTVHLRHVSRGLLKFSLPGHLLLLQFEGGGLVHGQLGHGGHHAAGCIANASLELVYLLAMRASTYSRTCGTESSFLTAMQLVPLATGACPTFTVVVVSPGGNGIRRLC